MDNSFSPQKKSIDNNQKEWKNLTNKSNLLNGVPLYKLLGYVPTHSELKPSQIRCAKLFAHRRSSVPKNYKLKEASLQLPKIKDKELRLRKSQRDDIQNKIIMDSINILPSIINQSESLIESFKYKVTTHDRNSFFSKLNEIISENRIDLKQKIQINENSPEYNNHDSSEERDMLLESPEPSKSPQSPKSPQSCQLSKCVKSHEPKNTRKSSVSKLRFNMKRRSMAEIDTNKEGAMSALILSKQILSEIEHETEKQVKNVDIEVSGKLKLVEESTTNLHCMLERAAVQNQSAIDIINMVRNNDSENAIKLLSKNSILLKTKNEVMQ